MIALPFYHSAAENGTNKTQLDIDKRGEVYYIESNF